MDLTSSKLHHEAQKNKTNECNEDLMSFCGNNGTLKVFKYLKACKENAPKILERKTSSFFKYASYKGYKVFQ